MQPQFNAAPLTDAWIKGACALYDLQTQTARRLLQLQARQAAAFGIPDFSNLFESGEGTARTLFSSNAEQMNQAARQFTELTQAQAELCKKLVDQATEQFGRNFAQVQASGRRDFDELQQMTQQTRSEIEKAVHEAMQAANKGAQANPIPQANANQQPGRPGNDPGKQAH